MRPKFYLILAKSENHGIGYQGSLPWRLSKEMEYFKKMTRHVIDASKQNAVIMGRKTWESIPQNRQPLPGRLNIVLSRSQMEPQGAVHCYNFDEMLNVICQRGNIETAWVIGGSQIYKSAMENNFCNRIYVTNILQEFPCDTFVNINLTQFKEVTDDRVVKGVQEEDGIKYEFKVYEQTGRGVEE